jgi:hypothetical protein
MKRILSLFAVACAYLSASAVAQSTATPQVEDPEPAMTRYVRSAWLVSQFHVGVPLLLDTDRDVVRPGTNLGMRLSFMSRYVGGGVHGSYQWIPIEGGRSSRDPFGQTGRRMPLRRAAFGPFVAAELPNETPFTPYVQGAFDLNFWNFDENAIVCDFWQCTSSNVYRFTPGFHGRVGAKFELATHRRIFLDLGLEGGVSFPGSFFSRSQGWATPYLGIGVAN